MNLKTKTMKFYEFNQNNSGGHFDVDENVCHRVVIEAESASEAESLFEPMILGQSASCSCCGDRWYVDADEINIEEFKEKGYKVGVYSHYDNPEDRWFKLYGEFPRLEEPKWGKTIGGSKEFAGKVYFNDVEQYCQFMANSYGWTSPDIRIHKKDGTKVEIFSKKVENE